MPAFVFVLVLVGAACAADAVVFPDFSSKTLDGQDVSADIFSKEKLTMVNLWTTWCPACVSGKSTLGGMARSMPEGSQLVGIVLDVEGVDDTATINEAKGILSEAQADFIQILPTMEMAPVLRTVRAVPKTIFVNSEGYIVGSPLLGALNEEAYRAEIERLLNSMR